MRKVQININLQIVNEETDPPSLQKITAYADANNLWEAICSGFDELMAGIREFSIPFPSLPGVRSHLNEVQE